MRQDLTASRSKVKKDYSKTSAVLPQSPLKNKLTAINSITLTELGTYVPLDTKEVISETLSAANVVD